MKNLCNLKIKTSLLIGALFIISCEKSETTLETEQILDQQEEGFKSETGNTDKALKIDAKAIQPILKMNFDATISKEEAILSFDKVVKEFVSKQPIQNKAFSTEWYYRVWTYTGNQSNNDTDGDAGTYVRFNTSAGGYTAPFNWMDNFGDDREGGWDAYLFKASFPGQAVQWVEIDYATLFLEGTDGWFVTDFVVQLWTSDQTLPATGSSSLWCTPNVWLDNSCSNSCWDSYFCDRNNTGRLNF